MEKGILLIMLCCIAAVSAGNLGYNYKNSEPNIVQTSHEVHQPIHTSNTHNAGYQKQFYYFNAPEEQHIDHVEAPKKITTHAKKNLQVIFIKPPEEKHHQKAVLNLAKNAVEEKTHIYVLTKEPSSHPSAKNTQIIQQRPVNHHKPEVHFVKYHTPADAHRIQQSIIQQYGGKPSEVIHGSIAPAVSFANTDSSHQSGLSVSREYLAPPISAKDTVPGNSYIPPAPRF